MDFDSAKKQFDRLTRLFRSGKIDQEEYIKGVDNLTIHDQHGVEWQIGMQSGQWYRKAGDEWVEDDPSNTKVPTVNHTDTRQSNKLWRRLIAVLLTLLVLFIVLGPQILGSGLRFNNDQKDLSGGEDVGDLNQGNGTPPARSTLEATTQNDDNTENPTSTTTSGQPTPTSETVDPSPFPSDTPTLPPPPPSKPPQIWEERVRFKIEEGFSLSNENDWFKFRDLPWEYEFLNVGGIQALLLQYHQEVALWFPNGSDVEDSDRTTTLAFPNQNSQISLLCRWDTEEISGYSLLLTQQRWELSMFENGVRLVLAEGPQSENFQGGNFETFRLQCVGQEIVVWAENKILAEVTNGQFKDGRYGLVFGVNEGVGVVYLEDDQVLVRKSQVEIAENDDIVRLDMLDVQLIGRIREYPQIPSSPYSGKPVIGVVLRIVNYKSIPVKIDTGNVYLQKGEQKNFALTVTAQDKGDQAEPDFAPMTLPQFLERGEVTGRVHFLGITLDELSEWQLVLDLRDQGFGDARFRLIDGFN